MATATPPKSAMSRLLGMKFMNRVPSSGGSNPASPSSLATSTSASKRRSGGGDGGGDDQRGDQRSTKRRRTLTGSSAGDSSAPLDGGIDLVAMQEAVQEHERKRQAAIKKLAAELGDEQWTWDGPVPLPASAASAPTIAAATAAASSSASASLRPKLPFTVVRVGFAQVDSRSTYNNVDSDLEDDNDDEPESVAAASRAKPQIMRFNMKNSQGASKESDSPVGDTDDPTQDSSLLLNLDNSRKRSRPDADKRQNKPVKLKNLTSLSSQGGQNAKKCHRCGSGGHMAKQCPSDKKFASKKR